MKIDTKAVHTGDRKKPGPHVPVTNPIYTATSYFYDSMEQLDRVFGHEEAGYCYARHETPSTVALEEVMCALEGGYGAQSCASGMAAIHIAVVGGAGGPAKVHRGGQCPVRRYRQPFDDRV